MPTDFDLSERAILALMTRFNTLLPEIIDQVNAERGGNTDPAYYLDKPAQILPAPPVAAQLEGSFPIVAVASGDITFEDDVGWGATGIYQLTLLAYEYDLDPVALAWKLLRWAEVLATVGLYGRNLDGGAFGTILRKIALGPRFSRIDPNQGKPVTLGFVAVMIEAKDEQNTP